MSNNTEKLESKMKERQPKGFFSRMSKLVNRLAGSASSANLAGMGSKQRLVYAPTYDTYDYYDDAYVQPKGSFSNVRKTAILQLSTTSLVSYFIL